MKKSPNKLEEKTYHWCEGHEQHDPNWVIHNTDYCCIQKKKQKEEVKWKNKYDDDTDNKY